MLFAQHAQQLQSGISSIQSRIDELEALLKGLRNDKSNLEAELQTVLTLEGAAESAISQSQSFVNAADSMGRTDLIETFWSAMNAMKNGAIAQLPEATPEPTPEPEPTNPIEPDTNPVQAGIITVEATEATEQEPDTVPDTNPVEPDTLPDTLPDTVPDTTPQNGKQPLSVGSAAFNPSEASLDDLKRYVRTYQPDDTTRQYGTLTRRSTWVVAAKKLLNS
jgi:TolA-binding protein